MKTRYSFGFAVLLTCSGLAAQAQIWIGQTAGFSGAVAAGVKETTDGAKLYLTASTPRAAWPARRSS